MNKFFGMFVLCFSLCFISSSFAGPTNKPAILAKYNLQPGDILAVSATVAGQTKFIFVMIQPDWTMDYVHDGRIHPFPVNDLDKYQWVLFERTEL